MVHRTIKIVIPIYFIITIMVRFDFPNLSDLFRTNILGPQRLCAHLQAQPFWYLKLENEAEITGQKTS
jgi:hypothetical protein